MQCEGKEGVSDEKRLHSTTGSENSMAANKQ